MICAFRRFARPRHALAGNTASKLSVTGIIGSAVSGCSNDLSRRSWTRANPIFRFALLGRTRAGPVFGTARQAGFLRNKIILAKQTIGDISSFFFEHSEIRVISERLASTDR